MVEWGWSGGAVTDGYISLSLQLPESVTNFPDRDGLRKGLGSLGMKTLLN